jgi:subtilisin family serine protease
MGTATAYVCSQDERSLPGLLWVVSTDGDSELYKTEDGTVEFELDSVDQVQHVLARSLAPGYWVAHADGFEDDLALVCGDLPSAGSASWWHNALGAKLRDPARGGGIRIGVVDAAFDPSPDLDHVRIVYGEGQGRAASGDPREWSHGEAVCRILSDRHAPPSCSPIAPGCELLFASGAYRATTRRDDSFVFPATEGDIGAYLDPNEVANAVYALAVEEEVDIINLSLGSFKEQDPDEPSVLAWAIEDALSMGTVVICAAGNRPVSGAAFPANRDDCIGVGALGAAGWGPPGSFSRHLDGKADQRGQWLSREIFYSPEAAYGAGIDMVAPGVGITIARDGRPAFDLIGTSFAAPIVSGLLAVALGGDPSYLGLQGDERRLYADRIVRGLCQSVGLNPDYEGEGLPMVR